MNRTQQSSQEAQLHNRIVQKLHPQRFPRMTPKMGAIVAYLLDIPVVGPFIAEIVVTSDGYVLVRAESEARANHFVGVYADLLRNWLGLLAVAGLTTTERMEAESLFAAKIGYFYSQTTA